MSNNEVFKIGKSQLYSQTFQLVAGATGGVLSQDVTNFYLGTSRIVGLVCTTPVGANAGKAVVTEITVNNSGTANQDHNTNITVAGFANTDASLYTLYWVNTSIQGSII